MQQPFHREFSDLFSSDRHALLKILGGGGVGFLITGGALFRDHALSPTSQVAILVLSVVLGMVVASALLLRDSLQARLDLGKPVNPLLKWFLCQRFVSLALWLAMAFVLAILYVLTL